MTSQEARSELVRRRVPAVIVQAVEGELQRAERLREEVQRFMSHKYFNTQDWPEIAACLKEDR